MIDTPLRPRIASVFRCFDDATTDAMALLNTEYAIAQHDSFLKAQGILDEAERIVETVCEPDQHILSQIIENWRRIFLEEGRRIIEQGHVAPFPNPYISGRALNPEDGRAFVDRRTVFREVEDRLQSGESVAIFGQRRIGKTSVLLHLQEHLPHNFLPVYIDLQSIPTEKCADLFFTITNRIVSRLKDANWLDAPSPDDHRFHVKPFDEFIDTLDTIGRRLSREKRVVIMLDEFEELEDQIGEGKLEERVYNSIRTVTQTNPRFVIVIAGRYTLRTMARDYSHSFFFSFKPISISYLDESDARELITGPVSEFLKYESEALDRIISITHGQPYLIQDLCHNIVTYLNDPQHRKNHVTLDVVNGILERTIETAENYFGGYVWGTSNQLERQVMAIIANLANIVGEGWVDHSEVEKRLVAPIGSESFNNLVDRGILEMRNKEEILEYRFQIELARQWIFRTQPLAGVLQESRIADS